MTEKQLWNETAAMLGELRVSWGDHWSCNFRDDPKRLGFVLSRYKFAAKMACQKGQVLELGCNSGIGAPILAERMESYLGIDSRKQEIEVARRALKGPKFSFIHENFLGKGFGSFDAIVSLDVESLLREHEKLYFETLICNLKENGICVVGISNESTAEQYERLSLQEKFVDALKRYFYQVFPFGMNDEVMQGGFGPMTRYLLCVGCHRR